MFNKRILENGEHTYNHDQINYANDNIFITIIIINNNR